MRHRFLQRLRRKHLRLERPGGGGGGSRKKGEKKLPELSDEARGYVSLDETIDSVAKAMGLEKRYKPAEATQIWSAFTEFLELPGMQGNRQRLVERIEGIVGSREEAIGLITEFQGLFEFVSEGE